MSEVGARQEKTKQVGPVIEFRTGDKSRDGGAIKHRCDNCVQTCVRLSVAGPAGGGREEKFER